MKHLPFLLLFLLLGCAPIPNYFRIFPELNVSIQGNNIDSITIVVTTRMDDYFCRDSSAEIFKTDRGKVIIKEKVIFQYFLFMDQGAGFNMCIQNHKSTYLGFRLFHMGPADEKLTLVCKIDESSPKSDIMLAFENYNEYQVCRSTEGEMPSRF